MTRREPRDVLDLRNRKDGSAPNAAARRNALQLLSLVANVDTEAVPPAAATRDEELWRLSCTLECANCGKDVAGPKLYCAELCAQTADLIRYVRRCIGDGRIEYEDIQEAIGTKLLMVVGGGYPRERRTLGRGRREEVFARDNYTCVLCGSEATQIDHIAGSSDDHANLRAVCGSCNVREAFANARTVTAREDPELFAAIEGIISQIAIRIASLSPTRVCDDETAWNEWQKQLLPARRIRFRETEEERETNFEDVDDYLYNAMQKDD